MTLFGELVWVLKLGGTNVENEPELQGEGPDKDMLVGETLGIEEMHVVSDNLERHFLLETVLLGCNLQDRDVEAFLMMMRVEFVPHHITSFSFFVWSKSSKG